MGTGVNIVGSIVSIVAGASMFVTSGATLPLVISAGVVTGVGAATTIGTKIARKVIKDKKFKEAEKLLGKRKDLLKKVDKKVGYLQQMLKPISDKKRNAVIQTILMECYNPKVCAIVAELLSGGGQLANSTGNI